MIQKQTWKDEIRILITDEENLGSVQISIPLYVSDIFGKADILLDTIYGRLYTVMRSGYGAFFIRKNKSVNDDMYLFELIEEDKCIAFFEVIGNKFDKEK